MEEPSVPSYEVKVVFKMNEHSRSAGHSMSGSNLCWSKEGRLKS